MSRILIDITDWNRFLYSDRVISGVHRLALGLMRAMRAGRLDFHIIRHDPATGRHRHVSPEFIDLDFTNRLFERNKLYRYDHSVYAQSRLAFMRKKLRYEIDRLLNKTPASYDAYFESEYAPQHGDVVYFCGAGWDAPETIDAVRRWKRVRRVKYVVAVHDFIPLISAVYSNKLGRRQFRRWFRDVASVADDYVCISQHTRSDFERFRSDLGVPRERLPVVITNPHEFAIPNSSGEVAGGASMDPSQNYILSVGATLSHKNGERLLEAWQLVNLWCDHNMKLVVVGGLDRGQVLHRFGAVDNLLIIPRASDGSLEALYKNSLCTVFPSLYEGWGLPVGESLWLGKACLASNATSVPEVGLDMCEYFDPLRPESIANALLKVIRCPQRVGELESRIDFRRLKSWADYAAEVHHYLSFGATMQKISTPGRVHVAAAE